MPSRRNPNPRRAGLIARISAPEQWLAKAIGENIVEVEVELNEAPHAVTLAAAVGDDQLGADLEVLSRPDQARCDHAGGRGRHAAVEGRAAGDFHERRDSVKRWGKPDVLDLALKINKAVFDGHPEIEDVRI